VRKVLIDIGMCFIFILFIAAKILAHGEGDLNGNEGGNARERAIPCSIPVPQNLFNIGNSIGEGMAANHVINALHHETVWSTGFDSEDSVFAFNERFEELAPAAYYENNADRDAIFNHAVAGDKMEDFQRQAEAIATVASSTPSGRAGMIAVFLGSNDVCQDEVGKMTDVGAFEAQYRAGLEVLRKSATTKNAVIQVTGIPAIYWLWIAKRDNLWCRVLAWPLVPCKELLENPSNDCAGDDSDLNPDSIDTDPHDGDGEIDGPNCVRRKQFHAVIRDGYNRILREVLQEYKDNGWLPNAYYMDIFDFKFESAHVNDGDCFHPSTEGHALLAQEQWRRLPWGTTDPACVDRFTMPWLPLLLLEDGKP
jgi:lysophospholipase L1-like esterase